jgi:hypothetical protein
MLYIILELWLVEWSLILMKQSDFDLYHHVSTGSGAQAASYTKGSFSLGYAGTA